MAGVDEPEPTVMGPYTRQKPETRYAGQSLIPLCQGKQPKAWRDSAYSESYSSIGNPYNYLSWARTIRTPQYRYTLYPKGTGEQLFDIQNDPNEQHNLVEHPDYQQVRQDLREQLFNKVVLQDFPHPERELFALGVH
jgi:arylsulfatase A-like enzyme